MRGLEFNAFAPNLLASGAEDGELYIWDLAAPAEPFHFPSLKVCRWHWTEILAVMYGKNWLILETSVFTHEAFQILVPELAADGFLTHNRKHNLLVADASLYKLLFLY